MKVTFANRLATSLGASLLAGMLASVVWATDTVTYLHTDPAGSLIAATDTSGNVLWTESYRPYGERTKNQAASANNRQFFHDKPFDQDSGLSNFGTRYYDPVVGRFMSVDPKGFSEKNLHSFNRYAYGNNNPYRFRDPDGNSPLALFAYYTGGGYAAGVFADALGQYLAWGQIDWKMAATSNAAQSGGEAGFLAALFGASSATESLLASRAAAESVRVGQAGEAAVRSIADIGAKTAIEVSGRTRIADGLTETVLTEVKNVKSLSFTQQLRDLATSARDTGRRFDLWVRPETELTQPLVEAVENGAINLRFFEGP